MNSDNGTFWDHLDVLRSALIRSIIVVTIASIVVFLLKDIVFEDIIFAATKSDFPTFRALEQITKILGLNSQLKVEPVKIINTQLAAQLFIHLSVSFYLGLTISIPYITGEFWHFIKPALYQNEKTTAFKAVVFMGILFYIGVLVNYFLIFPLSVNFLSAYKVMESIDNLIDIDSYIDTFVSMSLSMGIVFELPAAAYFLAKIEILKSTFLKKYRRHAFVLILTAAAMITPTTDIFTMLLVAAPLQLLYEISVKIVKNVETKNKTSISPTNQV